MGGPTHGTTGSSPHARQLRGHTFPSLSGRIGRIHMSSELLHTVCSVFTTVTTSDHLAVVLRVCPPQGPKGRPSYRFPLDMLECEEGYEQLHALLQQWLGDEQPVEQWWEGATVTSSAGIHGEDAML